MYYISKRMEIAGSHHLSLGYESPCASIHGHNWIITVHLKGPTLNTDGMLCDFSHIKTLIHGRLDHKNFNSVLPFNPTAEMIAYWTCAEINNYLAARVPNGGRASTQCYRVEVQESEGNIAEYRCEE